MFKYFDCQFTVLVRLISHFKILLHRLLGIRLVYNLQLLIGPQTIQAKTHQTFRAQTIQAPPDFSSGAIIFFCYQGLGLSACEMYLKVCFIIFCIHLLRANGDEVPSFLQPEQIHLSYGGKHKMYFNVNVYVLVDLGHLYACVLSLWI